MRIVEPFIKAHLALWLVANGAEDLVVSVDGAEPNPETVLEVLTKAGFAHTPNRNSSISWTGQYQSPKGNKVLVRSVPGADVQAILPGNLHFLAECKGQLTEKGTKAGNDKTAFYTGLGQLLVTAGQSEHIPEVIALVLPDVTRFVEMARCALANRVLRGLKISFLLVNTEGRLTCLPNDPSMGVFDLYGGDRSRSQIAP